MQEPGADLESVVGAERHHLFRRLGLDAIYLDLPLRDAGDRAASPTTWSGSASPTRGSSPTASTDGDVLRMQSLHRVRVKADDIAVASDHGRELLDYVLGRICREGA